MEFKLSTAIMQHMESKGYDRTAVNEVAVQYQYQPTDLHLIN
jgi:hypothetical protein